MVHSIKLKRKNYNIGEKLQHLHMSKRVRASDYIVSIHNVILLCAFKPRGKL